MSTSPTPLVHPQELGVREFSDYALVIDARSPREYAEDHLPGAVNLPVVDDVEFAEVGTLYRDNPHAAYLRGSQYALRNIADHIGTVLSRYTRDDRILVYCFRGGKRSGVWAEILRNTGFKTDLIKGGWKNYRRWVRGSLETLPPHLDLRLLAGSTGCGKTRLLQALREAGEQVLDLEGLAVHRGSLLGALPGRSQPSQKLFDSLLLEQLRRFDLAAPVWIEAESKKIGNIQLPDALYQAMRSARPFLVSAPLPDRVRLLQQEYAHLAADPRAMVEKLRPLKPLVGGDELDLWERLAAQGRVEELSERVISAHYDPCYERSRKHSPGASDPAVQVSLVSLAPAPLAEAATDLSRRFGRAGQTGLQAA
ncbi:tRNA 2-selenouridine(34) synthase MnmH [Aquabacterium sp. A7-Y]|uniref:tRNA 2-selenouridine(34) synthase MnmH n=1 Tax=Aquabacterium sp. A7-Y TaxID=1349605 RepID=UPI00223E6218|nr:tRNA 2-selenouridine(34) synthase MnmH [Aquabacterium sp. A7-Y]MCW7537036.1 tRNA 2-selenouridine(34) synthase MnmH [Aquabacterium sp. A7-Y]